MYFSRASMQCPGRILGMIGQNPYVPKSNRLEHLHPCASRQTLEMCFEGRAPSMHSFFLGWHSATLTLHTGSSIRKTVRNIPVRTQKWQVMRSRNLGAARATLIREDSEWSRKFEEPGQEGWDCFFCQAASMGLPRPIDAQGWRCSYML